MQYKHTNTNSHRYREVYLERRPVVSMVVSSILVSEFVLLDIYAWKLGKYMRAEATLIVRTPLTCHPHKSPRLSV